MKITRMVLTCLVSVLLLMGSAQIMAQNQQQGAENQKQHSKQAIQAVQVIQRTILTIYNINEQNYQKHLSHAKQFFTEKGWKDLDIANTKLIKAVQNGEFSLDAQFDRDKKPRVGRDTQAQQPTWIVQLPFTAVYKGDFKENKKQHTQSLMATAMLVQHQDHLKIERLLIQHANKEGQQTQQKGAKETRNQPNKARSMQGQGS